MLSFNKNFLNKSWQFSGSDTNEPNALVSRPPGTLSIWRPSAQPWPTSRGRWVLMKLRKIPFSSKAFVALSKMNQFSVSITDLTVLIPPRPVPAQGGGGGPCSAHQTKCAASADSWPSQLSTVRCRRWSDVTATRLRKPCLWPVCYRLRHQPVHGRFPGGYRPLP